MAHFYERKHDGGVTARHFVPMSSRPNELRPTRITDVRKWWKKGQLVVPSVTTVISVLDKGALNDWKIKQHLEVAYGLNPRDYATVEDYTAEVMRLTEIKLDKAPSDGTAIHKVLEDYANGIEPSDPIHQSMIENIQTKLGHDIREKHWEAERYFVAPNGFGGCTDLLTHKGQMLLDWKSKQTSDKFKPGKMVYDDHRMQLAAYRVGHKMPWAKCGNGFVCLENGDVDIHWLTEAELAKGWAMFTRALEIWQIRNDYPADLMVAA